MADNVYRRMVKRSDDPFGIPACFYWTVDEVADWVESIGYGKYKENFRSHFINGRKLLTIDACTLPKLGIVHFGDILDLSGRVRNLLCSGRRRQYRHPGIEIPFNEDLGYSMAPVDGIHPDYLFYHWMPRVKEPEQIWLSHPEFIASTKTDISVVPYTKKLYSLEH